MSFFIYFIDIQSNQYFYYIYSELWLYAIVFELVTMWDTNNFSQIKLKSVKNSLQKNFICENANIVYVKSEFNSRLK